MNILIVDDEELICEVLNNFLDKQGHTVITANSPDEALKKIKTSKGQLDILLTDICMPNEDGISFLEKMKHLYPEVHVILMSGNMPNINASSIIEKGGSAFLRKPLKLGELELLINQISKFRHDKGLLKTLNTEIATERDSNNEMIKDLQFARKMHSRIFPRDYSWLTRTKIHIRYIPMASVGGDYIDIKPYGKNKVLFWISDTSGHGTPAAFGVIALKTWFSSLPFNLTPSKIMADAEKILLEIFPEEFFATALCGIYDEKERTLIYSVAGHPHPFIISHSGKFRILKGGGTALGFSGSPVWSDFHENLAEHDILIAYTDGVTQTPGTLIKHLAKHEETPKKIAANDLAKLVTHILDINNEVSPNQAYADDLAVFTLSPAKPQTKTQQKTLNDKTVLLFFQHPDLYSDAEAMLQDYKCVLYALALDDINYEYISQYSPDVVIIELSQANESEYSIITDLRKKYNNIPILAVSDQETEKQLRLCIKSNASGFLNKPFDKETFINSLIQAMQFSEEKSSIELDDIAPDWVDFVISSSPTVLDLLNRYLKSLERQPIPTTIKEDILYCIREITSNAIEWGNLHQPDLKVRISTVIQETKVMIKITDEGSGFNVKQCMNPASVLTNQEQREQTGKREGGFGLTIVKEIMDSVIFNDKGNAVLLTKNY